MNARALLLRTADHLDECPHLFDFGRVETPSRKQRFSTTACALGWLAHFAGINREKPPYPTLWDISEKLLKVDAGEFYERMNAINSDWQLQTGRSCAHALRRYVDKFHPEESSRPRRLASVLNFFRKPGAL